MYLFAIGCVKYTSLSAAGIMVPSLIWSKCGFYFHAGSKYKSRSARNSNPGPPPLCRTKTVFRQKVTLFFLLVLIGNYARGGGGPSTKFYCWHVLTYFYKKIFRRELVISFCPVGTSIFSIMAEFGNVGSGFGWTSLCKTGWDENAGGQLASEMMATSDDQPVCRYTHCWDIAGIILRLCNMLMTLVVYAVCTLPDISGIIPRTHRWVLPCQGWMIFWARARLNCSNILWASFTSVVFFSTWHYWLLPPI